MLSPLNTLTPSAHSRVYRIWRADRQRDWKEGCPSIHTKPKRLGFGKVPFVEGLLVGGSLPFRYQACVISAAHRHSGMQRKAALEGEYNTRRASAAGWSGGTTTAKGGGYLLGKLQVTIHGISTAAKHRRRSQTMRLKKNCKKDTFSSWSYVCFFFFLRLLTGKL